MPSSKARIETVHPEVKPGVILDGDYSKVEPFDPAKIEEFVSSAWQGDLIELGLVPTAFGRTSLTLRARVRNMVTRETIIDIERIVMVGLDGAGRPQPHGYDHVTFDRDRVPQRHAPIPRPPIVDLPTGPVDDLD